MLPSPLPPSAALSVAELLGPVSVLLLISLLATFVVLIAWLVGERLERGAWRRAADAWTAERPAPDQPLGRATASRT
jgi:hypothetical protein